MFFAPKQKSVDYEFLYCSQLNQNKELTEQHELLGGHIKRQNSRIAELEQLLKRWHTFGKAMQKAGSELPRHLITDTETIMKEKK